MDSCAYIYLFIFSCLFVDKLRYIVFFFWRMKVPSMHVTLDQDIFSMFL